MNQGSERSQFKTTARKTDSLFNDPIATYGKAAADGQETSTQADSSGHKSDLQRQVEMEFQTAKA